MAGRKKTGPRKNSSRNKATARKATARKAVRKAAPKRPIERRVQATDAETKKRIDTTARRVHAVIRKGMHLFVYAALGLLAFRASWLSFGNLLARVAMVAILVALGVALIDESRQSGYDSRTGSPYDVAIDAVGAACAVGIASLSLRRRLAPRRGREAP